MLMRIDTATGDKIEEEPILQSIDMPLMSEQIICDFENNRYFAYVYDNRIYVQKKDINGSIIWTISNQDFTEYTLTEDQDIEGAPSLTLDFYNYLNMSFSLMKSGITYFGLAKISRDGIYSLIYQERVTNELLTNPIRPTVKAQPANERTLLLYARTTETGIEPKLKIIGTVDSSTGNQLTREIIVSPPSLSTLNIATINLHTISETEKDKQILLVNRSSPIPIPRNAFANVKGINYFKIINGGITANDISFQGKISSSTHLSVRNTFKTNTYSGSSQITKDNTLFDSYGRIIHVFEYKDTNNVSNIGLVKVARNGTKMWESTAGILTRANNEYTPKIAKDQYGNVIIVFSTDSITRGLPFKNGFDIVIAKFSGSTGTLIWSIRSLTVNTNNNDLVPSISVDGEGNLIIASFHDNGRIGITKIRINDTELLRDTLTIQLTELTSESQNILNDITLISESITILSAELQSIPTEDRKIEIQLEIETYQTQLATLQTRINILSIQITEINTLLDTIGR